MLKLLELNGTLQRIHSSSRETAIQPRRGIGKNNPGYPLEVSSTGPANTITGFTWSAVTNGAVLEAFDGPNTGNFPSTGSTPSVSIKSSAWVWAQGLVVSSDERIKENIIEVPDNLALQMLRDIDCNYYEYKDKIKRGTQQTIGFIAQQVKQHLPMAVSLEKSIIPNELRVLVTSWDGLNMSVI